MTQDQRPPLDATGNPSIRREVGTENAVSRPTERTFDVDGQIAMQQRCWRHSKREPRHRLSRNPDSVRPLSLVQIQVTSGAQPVTTTSKWTMTRKYFEQSRASRGPSRLDRGCCHNT